MEAYSAYLMFLGVSCLLISAAAIRPSLNPIETQREALQKRLLDLVLQRQKVHDALRELMHKLEEETPVNPIEVKEEAA